MGLSKKQPDAPEVLPAGRITTIMTVGAAVGLALACCKWAILRAALARHAVEAACWLLLAATAFNPLPLVPERYGGLVPHLLVASWLVTVACLCYGSPMSLFEQGWRAMTAQYELWQIAVFGSALLHVALTLLLNVFPVVVQNTARLQTYKVQPDKPPASLGQWWHVFVHITASQLLVQLPLITGQYLFIRYFSITYDYDSMPQAGDLAWRLALALVVDDAWVYFAHRALHDKRIYKHIHKVHHTYQAPFAPDAEYEHPVETVFLGIGFFTACMLFTNHLAFMWAWLYVRLLVTYESHQGYDLPYNLFQLLPCYNGAREHDWHHQFFNGNYAPTFQWWDRLFGTSAPFEKHERQRRLRLAAQHGEELERRGDLLYASKGPPGPRAGVLEKEPGPVPFSKCLVTGSEGLVGPRLVALLAARGAKHVVRLDAAEGPTSAFKELAERCKEQYGTELTYVQIDISSEGAMVFDKERKSPFEGVEVVFHLAAPVGPFVESSVDEAVNAKGAQNVLAAFLRDGGCPNGNVVLVDCSLTNNTTDPMEHELAYGDRFHEYATTKAGGEKRAGLEANGREAAQGGRLASCAVVAPHQVYGPGDELFLPCMLQLARAGRLRICGKGETFTSFTHADNLAHGCILAAAKLWQEGAQSAAAGQLFAVTDTGAQSFWDVVDDAVVTCGAPSLYSKFHLAPCALWPLAYAGVVYTWLTGKTLKLTPSTLRMLLVNRTFCTAKARHVLGYAPVISFEDGWKETVAAARERFGIKTKDA